MNYYTSDYQYTTTETDDYLLKFRDAGYISAEDAETYCNAVGVSSFGDKICNKVIAPNLPSSPNEMSAFYVGASVGSGKHAISYDAKNLANNDYTHRAFYTLNGTNDKQQLIEDVKIQRVLELVTITKNTDVGEYFTFRIAGTQYGSDFKDANLHDGPQITPYYPNFGNVSDVPSYEGKPSFMDYTYQYVFSNTSTTSTSAKSTNITGGVYFKDDGGTIGVQTTTGTLKFAPICDGTPITDFHTSTQTPFNLTDDLMFVARWNSSNTNRESTFRLHFRTEDACLKHIAKMGFAFKVGDKIYKPVVTDGYITGYTDDLNSTSEWDNWHNISDHDKPSGRPSSKTDNDGIDDMEFNNNDLFCRGMVDYYIVPYGGLDAISEAITNDTVYTGVAENIVSLMGFYITPSLFASGSESTMQVGRLPVDYSGAIKINVLTPVLYIGSVKVSGKHGTLGKPHFLDYAPYTKLDLYIPFCGVVDLPSRVMYNTIDIYLLGDVITGSCNAVVKCNGEIVATKAGMIGRNVPMTYTASAEQTASMVQGVMNSVAIGGQVLLSGATNNIAGMVSGTMAGVANISQQIQASNANYTHHIGTTGSVVEGAMPDSCYLRRFRPEDKSDDTYNSTYGRPCCKTKTLATGMGFTIVDNPRISGGMTETEKNEIIAMLKTGVIL